MGRSKSIIKKQPYIRKEIYSIDEVYNAVLYGVIYSIDEVYNAVKDGLFEEKKTFVDMDGDMIKANSQRYQTFFTKGIKCCRCGIEGRYFAKEKNPNARRYHLNLYAVDQDGEEVMMTKDHIIPVSKGGKNTLENYQTMCRKCNVQKGNKLV